MEKENDNYLSDWLSNKISDEQLRNLVGESDFLSYLKIRQALDNLELSQPEMSLNYRAIQSKISDSTGSKNKTYKLYKFTAFAASFALLFGLYYFFIFNNVVNTEFREFKNIELADNSKVILNANSKLEYSNSFIYNRKLHLEGEAFFEVSKGSSFVVETNEGNVRVLGTKFNVEVFNDYFEVKCFEGKVEVSQNNNKTILTKGESIRHYKNAIENWSEIVPSRPSWTNGESSFKNAPMYYVIEQFKNQYNVNIQFPDAVKEIRFTGTFTHNNLDVALKTVCLPLNLKYKRLKNDLIVISR